MPGSIPGISSGTPSSQTARSPSFFGLDAAATVRGLPLEDYLARVHPDDRPELAKKISRSARCRYRTAEYVPCLGQGRAVPDGRRLRAEPFAIRADHPFSTPASSCRWPSASRMDRWRIRRALPSIRARPILRFCHGSQTTRSSNFCAGIFGTVRSCLNRAASPICRETQADRPKASWRLLIGVFGTVCGSFANAGQKPFRPASESGLRSLGLHRYDSRPGPRIQMIAGRNPCPEGF